MQKLAMFNTFCLLKEKAKMFHVEQRKNFNKNVPRRTFSIDIYYFYGIIIINRV